MGSLNIPESDEKLPVEKNLSDFSQAALDLLMLHDSQVFGAVAVYPAGMMEDEKKQHPMFDVEIGESGRFRIAVSADTRETYLMEYPPAYGNLETAKKVFRGQVRKILPQCMELY